MINDYNVRQAAKSVVTARLARRFRVRVSYAIGVPRPLSVFVGTGKFPVPKILEGNFDFHFLP